MTHIKTASDQTPTTVSVTYPTAPTDIVWVHEPKRRAPDPPPRPPANRYERRRAAAIARRKR